MDINIIEDTAKKLVFELPGESHTLVNSLKTELWNNKNIKTATYSLKHPLVGIPKMIIETEGVKPRAALEDTTKKLIATASEFKKVCTKKL